MSEKRQFIGEYLVKKGIISQEQFDQAFEDSQRMNKRVGDILVQSGMVREEEMVQALSQQLDIPFLDATGYQFDPACVPLIPKGIAQRLQAIAVYKIGNSLAVMMVDPLNMESIEELEQLSQMSIMPVFGSKTGITEAIGRYYEGKTGRPAAPAADKMPGRPGSEKKGAEQASTQRGEESDQAEVVKLVDEIIAEAVRRKVSDIHVEPQEDGFFCRYRLDGIMQPARPLPTEHQSAIISRLKIMADIDISEKRLPQDGRIRTQVDEKEIDLRVASFPTIYGEYLAIRILDKSAGVLSLEQLGMHGELLTSFKSIISKPHGIILVTGPTGSGKSTTLYSSLNTLNDSKRNIITLEDPVEYSISNIHQGQVNAKAGLTFALGLRSIVRLDPDIIMIGEIRDKETAEIAIHAALTGHVVFSSLHTNDAPSACARLINIGVEPYLVSSSLIGVLAQRLVRKLCEKCKQAYVPTPEELAMLGISQETLTEKINFYREAGCPQCRQTGFKGRIGIFELFLPDDKTRELITRKAAAHELFEVAKKGGMKTMMEDSFQKILTGKTTLSEVLRVTAEI